MIDLNVMRARAESFALYHAERASYRGASREFHELACSFLRGDVFALVAEVERLRSDIETLRRSLEIARDPMKMFEPEVPS